jgi:ATP-dependent Lon protease
MTGEITLRGNVLPIGGVKEKVLAAHRAGIRVVVLPEENRKDLEDVPEKVRKVLEFHFVSRIEEVLKLALLPLAHSDEVQGEAHLHSVYGAEGIPITEQRREERPTVS